MNTKTFMIIAATFTSIFAVSLFYFTVFGICLDHEFSSFTEIITFITLVYGYCMLILSPIIFICRKRSKCLKVTIAIFTTIFIAGYGFLSFFIIFNMAPDYLYDELERSVTYDSYYYPRDNRNWFERKYNCVGLENCHQEMLLFIDYQFTRWSYFAMAISIAYVISAIAFLIAAFLYMK